MLCRIPCEFGTKNLSVRVEEKSRIPNYLSVKFLYQGGQTDIVAVDVAQVIILISYFLILVHGSGGQVVYESVYSRIRNY